MFHFNCATRVARHKHNIKGVPGLDYCYDCRAEIHILEEYLANLKGLERGTEAMNEAIRDMSLRCAGGVQGGWGWEASKGSGNFQVSPSSHVALFLAQHQPVSGEADAGRPEQRPSHASRGHRPIAGKLPWCARKENSRAVVTFPPHLTHSRPLLQHVKGMPVYMLGQDEQNGKEGHEEDQEEDREEQEAAAES